MADKIFRHQWTGAYTLRDKLLYVIPAGVTQFNFLVDPEPDSQAAMADYIVDLPPGCMTPPKLAKKWDKHPIGLPSECPIMEITWRLGEIPEDDMFNEFHDSVLKPKMELTVTPDGFFGSWSIKAGTYYKYYQNIDDSWVLVFDGIHNEGTKGFLDLEPADEDVEVKSLAWMTLHETPTENLFVLYFLLGLKRNAIIELMYPRNAIKYAYIQQVSEGGDNEYSLLSGAEVFTAIEQLCDATARSLTRCPVQSTIVSYPLTKYYKQTYDESGALGAEIGFENLMFNGRMFDYYFSPDVALNTPNKYGRMIDWFVDWYKESLTKGWLVNSALHAVYIYDDTHKQVLTADVLFAIYDKTKNKSDRPQIGISPDTLGYVDSSLYEQIYDDIDVVHYGDGANDDESVNLPITCCNHPVVTDMSVFRGLEYHEYSYVRAPWVVMMKTPVPLARVTGLTYMDKPDMIHSSCPEPGMPFRVHEFCDTPLNTAVNVSDLPGCGFVPFDYPGYNASGHEGDYAWDLSCDYCKPKIQARAVYTIFKDANTLKITLSADAYDGRFGCLWRYGELTEFELDISDFKSRLTGQPTKWYITEIEYDDEKERYTIVLISGLRDNA